MRIQPVAITQPQARATNQAIEPTAPAAAASPESLYAFELTAEGPRAVSAALAFDTNAGWFTADVPSVQLTEKDRHYSSDSGSFVVHDWVSPVMYVRFPVNLTITHRWVSSATAKNDGEFGWQKQGRFECPPPAPTMEREGRYGTILMGVSRWNSGSRTLKRPISDPQDSDLLRAKSGSDAIKILAARSAPLETTHCTTPFQDAAAIRQFLPAYPPSLRGTSSFGLISLELAIDVGGKLGDVWVWGTSGRAAFDETAISGIEQSTFRGARAYCRDVPALYDAYMLFDSY